MDSVLHHLYDVMETWRAPTTQMNEIVRAFPANSSVATAIVFVLTTYVTGFNIALTVPTRQTAVGNIKFYVMNSKREQERKTTSSSLSSNSLSFLFENGMLLLVFIANRFIALRNLKT